MREIYVLGEDGFIVEVYLFKDETETEVLVLTGLHEDGREKWEWLDKSNFSFTGEWPQITTEEPNTL